MSDAAAPQTEPADERKQLALPPVLKAVLDEQLISITRHESEGDRIELDGVSLLKLDIWEYHVLNAMFGFAGDSFHGLRENVRDTFGLSLTEASLRQLILDLDDLDIINPTEARRHPLIKQVLSENTITPPNKAMEEAREKQVATQPVLGAAGAKKKPGFVLLRPKWLMKALRGLSFLGTPLLIALVPMVVMAVFFTIQNWELVSTSFLIGHRQLDLVELLLIGFLTVNVASVVVQAVVAHSMTATVEAFVLRFYMMIIPRLGARLDDTDKLSRRQAMWLHASPLFTMLFMSASGILLWNSTRHFEAPITDLALTVGGIGFIAFVIAACPFLNGSGYRVMVEYLDEPELRGKAIKSLLNVGSSKFYQLANPQILLAYAMISILFTLLVIVFILFVLEARLLHEYGTTGYVVFGCLTAGFIWRVVGQLRTTNEIYWQSYRFERWRERTLPSQEQKKVEKKNRFNMWRVIQLMLITLIVIGLVQPYPYRPSGSVTLLPASTRDLSTDIEGVVREVYVEGGSLVPKGTLVAELFADDIEAQVRVLQAQLNEQQLAVDFAQTNCERDRQLAEAGTISDTAYQRTLASCAAEDAELETIKANIQRLEGQIERSRFVMPFDGQVGTLYLKERLGSFLREGEPIATVNDTSSFRVQLQIREVDFSLVNIGEPVEVRVYAYPDRVFTGTVASIDAIVDDTLQGNIIEVVASIENEDQLLKPGMTGFAKTTGIELPVWRIMTQAIWRFFIIDFWAWLP